MLEKQSLLILRGGIAAFQGMPDDKFFDEEFIHREVKKEVDAFTPTSYGMAFLLSSGFQDSISLS